MQLQPDLRCGIYAERPLVCRIYPAEINPFIELAPASKACPPEAWTPGLAPLVRAGKLVDAATVALIQQSRDADTREAPAKQRLCALLGVDTAALSNEGFVVYSPRREDLMAALQRASEVLAAPAAAPESAPARHFVSNWRASVDALVSVGALGAWVDTRVDASSTMPFEYLGFFPAAA